MWACLTRSTTTYSYLTVTDADGEWAFAVPGLCASELRTGVDALQAYVPPRRLACENPVVHFRLFRPARRVVEVVDSGQRYGFTYGTMSVHPERGEESFTVTRQSNDEVTFEIVAASRPRSPLARAFPPIARRLQRGATARYLDAMKTAVAR